MDVYYLLARCILYKQRMINCVGDKFIFKIPGKLALSVFALRVLGCADTPAVITADESIACPDWS